MAVKSWTRKSLLTIEDLKPDEISLILDKADEIKGFQISQTRSILL